MAAAQLTDQELFLELKRLGFSPGPVTEDTRPVYLKKLKKLRDEQQQRGTRSSKTRNSIGINNNSNSNAAARASGIGARPTSNDVTHLNTGRSPGGRPALNEKRPVGAGKLVLGFSSDESDVEVNLKKGLQHSVRRERSSGYHQQQSRPTTTPTAVRRSQGVGVSPGNSSVLGLLEGKGGGSGSPWWGDGGKSRSVVSRTTENERTDYGRTEEDEDYDGRDINRDNRTHNGSRISYSLSSSSKVDYSDSDEEGKSTVENQRDRRFNSRRSHSKSELSSHKSVGQEKTGNDATRINDKLYAGSRVVTGNRRSEDDEEEEEEDEEEEEEEEEEGGRKGDLEETLCNTLRNPSYMRTSSFGSGIMGESHTSPSAYNNHVNSAGSSSIGRFGVGIRPRYSINSSPSTTYRSNHSNHTFSNHIYTQAARTRKLAVPEEELLQQFKREEVSVTGGVSAHYLSMFLLTAACLFFIVLGLMYLRMRGSGTSEAGVVIRSHPFGPEFDQTYSDEAKDAILKVLLRLHDHLATIAGDHECEHSRHSNRSLSVREAEEYLILYNEGLENLMNSALEWIIRTGEDVGIRLLARKNSKKDSLEPSLV